METLTFHSEKGTKSALAYIMDDFSFSYIWVYVPRRAFGDNPEKDVTTREINMTEYHIVDLIRDGEPVKAEDGTVLKTLQRK